MGQEISEVRIGRSNVKFGGVDLGFTEGDITLTFTHENRDFRPDQSTLKLKKFLINEDATITIPLVQTVAKSLARAKAFPTGELKAELVGGGGSGLLTVAEVAGSVSLTLDVGEGANFSDNDFALVGSGPKAEMVEIDSVAGDVLTLKATTPIQFAHAIGEAVVEVDSTKTRIAIGDSATQEAPTAEILITPIDGSDPIKFYKAQVSDDVELVLQKGEESIVELTFEALGDLSRAKGDRLFSIGDQSVT